MVGELPTAPDWGGTPQSSLVRARSGVVGIWRSELGSTPRPPAHPSPDPRAGLPAYRLANGSGRIEVQ